jgi:hypothetical protein
VSLNKTTTAKGVLLATRHMTDYFTTLVCAFYKVFTWTLVSHGEFFGLVLGVLLAKLWTTQFFTAFTGAYPVHGEMHAISSSVVLEVDAISAGCGRLRSHVLNV